MTEWQTMESAPRNEDEIVPILIATITIDVGVGHWGEWAWGGGHGWFWDDGRPIEGAFAWMPLPAHPLHQITKFPAPASPSQARLQEGLYKFETDLMAIWADQAEAHIAFAKNPSEQSLAIIREIGDRYRAILFERLFPTAKYDGLTIDEAYRRVHGVPA